MAEAENEVERYFEPSKNPTDQSFLICWHEGYPTLLHCGPAAARFLTLKNNPGLVAKLRAAFGAHDGRQEPVTLIISQYGGPQADAGLIYVQYEAPAGTYFWSGIVVPDVGVSGLTTKPAARESMDLSVWLTDGTGKVVYTSAALDALTGALRHTDQALHLETLMQRVAAASGAPVPLELSLPESRSGPQRYNLVCGRGCCGPIDAKLNWYAIIPEECLAGDQLSRGLEAREIANLMRENIIIHNIEGRSVFVNKALQKFFGLTEATASFLDDFAPLAPTREFELGSAIMHALRSGQFVSDNFMIKVPSGANELHAISIIPLFNREGRSCATISFGHNLADDPLVIRSIAESQAKLNGILNAFPDLILLRNQEGRVLFSNRALERFLGRQPGQLVGERLSEFFPKAALDAMTSSDQEAIDAPSSDTIDYEIEFEAAEGKKILAVRKRFLAGKNGKPGNFLIVARDKTAEYKMKQRAEADERRFQFMTDLSPDCIARYAPDGTLLYMNKTLVDLLPAAPETYLGRNAPSILRSYVATQELADKIEHVIKTGEACDAYCAIKLYGGQSVVHHVKVAAEFDPQGKVSGIFSTGRDITAARTAEDALIERDEALDEARGRLASIVTTLPDMVWLIDSAGQFRLCNPAFERFTGYSQKQLYGQKAPFAGFNLPPLLWQDDFPVSKSGSPLVMERRISHPVTGAFVHLEIRKMALFSEAEKPRGFVCIARDISVRKNLELALKASKTELQKQAYSDVLTDMPNRRHWMEKIEDQIASTMASGTLGAVLMIDLDRFSAINDSVGHTAGDVLLIEMARRIMDVAKAHNGFAARWNGDEFVVYFPNIDRRETIERISERFLTGIAKSVFSENRVLNLSASIGIALVPEHSTQSEDLITYADSAMFEAKREGRNTWRVFDESLVLLAKERFELEADIRKGMEEDQFTSHFQAKINLATGEITGIEALMRWKHPERGNIPPAVFIPLAEETGLILPLGEKILTDACHFARLWNDGSRKPARIAVNLSPRQIMFDDFMPLLKSSLSRTGCKPEWLELEITENILLSDEMRITDLMQGLTALGVSIAIDDFGTGYSAMSYLTRYPISTIKIDRSFVHNVTRDSKKAVLVRAIVAMASGLGMNTVAEGIETAAEAELMLEFGCNDGQGFLWNRPMAKDAFMHWSATRDKKAAAE